MAETVDVVRVFVGPDGSGGNPLGVFLHAPDWPAGRRQEIAAELDFSETVFVADPATAQLYIHTRTHELPLAGHPLVGTSWLLAQRGMPTDTLRPPAGAVPTWQDGAHTWIRANPALGPDFELRQLASPAEVEAYPGAGPDELLLIWAWQDETAGRVRVRVFPTAHGATEDEATGSAALRLGALLNRPLTITQGAGSELLVAPRPDGLVEVGGRVTHTLTRDY